MKLRLFNTAILGTIAVLATGNLQSAEQKAFKTPQAAAQALVSAAHKGAREEVVAILGKEVRERLSTGSPAQDQVEKAVLLKLAQEATVARPDDKNPDLAIVYLG